MTIYLVDEDHAAYGAWIAELELRGHKVTSIASAADAFRELCRVPAEQIGVVLIDVMLAPGEDWHLYPQDFLTTGLELLRSLSQQKSGAFSRRAILLTNAVGSMLEEAITYGETVGAEVWDKRSIVSPVHFADAVEEFGSSRGIT